MTSEGRSTGFAKAFYFFYYAAGASLLPFLALYYRDLGLSEREIGLLAGISPLTVLFSASLWGGLADATQWHRGLLGLAIAGAVGFALVLSSVTTFLRLIPAVAAFAFFVAPIIPLVDHSVLDLLGEQRANYGRVRLWGALGWGVAATTMGRLVEEFGLGWSFYGYAALMSVGLIAAMRMPVAHARIGGAFRQGLRVLLRNRQWLLFLAAVWAGSMGLSTVHNFLFLYMEDLGASKSLMGLSLTSATFSELLVFFFSGRMLDRWGTRRLLIFSLLAHVLRLLAYALIRTPWLVLGVQLLHGPTFSLAWVAGVAYANRMAPAGMGATAQGFLSAVYFGLGSAAGAFIGGMLYEDMGPFWMFLWAGVWVLGGLLLFAIYGRDPAERGQRR